MGSRKPSCKNIIREIWLDFASTVDRHQFEWRLDPNIFSADFSAASFFSKLPHCVSGQYLTREIRLSEALPSDAFILDWSTFFFFFFLPFSFLPRVLQKLKWSEADCILIAPLWIAQAWFTKLLRLLVNHPVLLPAVPGLLEHPVSLVKRTLQTHGLQTMDLILC